MKRLLILLLLLVTSVTWGSDWVNPYDPGAARKSDLDLKLDLDGGNAPTTISLVNASFTGDIDILGNVYASGSAIVGAGTAAEPAYTTVGDENTGIYFPAADTVGVSVGGNQVASVTSAGVTSTFNLRTLSNTISSGAITNDGGRFMYQQRHDTGGTVRPDGQNLFIGLGAGNLNIGAGSTLTYQGSTNVGIGNASLQSLTTGYGNTAIGRASAWKTTTGNTNVAIGDATMNNNTTGGSNTAVGRYSLANNVTGNDNTAIGQTAGTYYGGSTSNNLTTTNCGVFIGQNSQPLADDSTNEIVIGYEAIGAGNNTVTLGNTSITKTVLRGVIQTNGIPEYADNAAAKTAGLVDGAFYHTAGTLKVVYTP